MARFERAILRFLLDKGTDCKEMQLHLNKNGIDAVLQYAKANKVLFALAAALDGRKCLAGHEAKKAREILAAEKALHLRRVFIAKQAMQAFEKAGCPVLTMKSFFPFPYADNDVDFVAAQGFQKCRRALEGNGFALEKSRSYLREPLKRFFSLQGSSVFVHLHSAFSWNGIRYIDSTAAWEQREVKRVSGIDLAVPNATYDFLVTAAHSVFENKCIYLADFLNAILLAESGKVDWVLALRSAEKLNWKHALASLMLQLDALHRHIFGKRLFPEEILQLNGFELGKEKILFPYVLRGTFSASFRKLLLDIAKLRLLQLPRQLFSYTVVDYLLQRRAIEEKRSLEALLC